MYVYIHSPLCTYSPSKQSTTFMLYQVRHAMVRSLPAVFAVFPNGLGVYDQYRQKGVLSAPGEGPDDVDLESPQRITAQVSQLLSSSSSAAATDAPLLWSRRLTGPSRPTDLPTYLPTDLCRHLDGGPASTSARSTYGPGGSSHVLGQSHAHCRLGSMSMVGRAQW